MNILEILNNLGTQNIEGLINLISTLFGNSSNSLSPVQQSRTPEIEAPPETNFDASSSYWSLPTYQFDAAQNNNSAQNSKSAQSNVQYDIPPSTFAGNNMQSNYINQRQPYIDSTMQQNSMHSTMHSTVNTGKNGNFFEILKILLPLLTKSSQNNTNTVSTEQSKLEQKESVILSLKKTSDR